MSTKNINAFAINGIENRFQEPISIVDYTRDIQESELVDLSVIDLVPISLVVSSTDNFFCPSNQGQVIYDLLGDTKK